MTIHNGESVHDGKDFQKPNPQTSPVQPIVPHVPPAPAIPVSPSMVGGLPADTSVIGADLEISGQDVHVISKGKIRVEGKIQGDVLGTEVVIGDVGTVEGVVSGDKVRVFGAIMGTIRGVQVEIEAGAKVEADVHHHTLSVDSRAQIEGRVRRARDIAELKGPEQALQDADTAPSVEAAPQAGEVNSRRGRLWG